MQQCSKNLMHFVSQSIYLVIIFQSKEIEAQIEETKQEGLEVKEAIKKLMVRLL